MKISNSSTYALYTAAFPWCNFRELFFGTSHIIVVSISIIKSLATIAISRTGAIPCLPNQGVLYFIVVIFRFCEQKRIVKSFPSKKIILFRVLCCIQICKVILKVYYYMRRKEQINAYPNIP